MSKAATLDLLSRHADRFVIDPYITFTVREWVLEKPYVLDRVYDADVGPIVVVRSSVATEDTFTGQPPGTFHSELNIPLASKERVVRAIDRVIDSYNKSATESLNAELNKVIVQRQLLNPLLGGVLMSRDSVSHEPYYVIEYDDATGRTDTVTSGKLCKRVYAFREAANLGQPWKAVVEAARSVERLLGNEQLFIEFALSRDGKVHVFQARQMRLPGMSTSFSDDNKVEVMISAAQESIGKRPYVMWSDMADWNPAEMLGERPRTLDISLYQYLITDGNWAEARASLGYKNVSPNKLMRSLACKPYINVATAFQSLVPADLPAALARRLVRNRLDALRNKPELHDKVELEVLFTCADVATPSRTEVLRAARFSRSEIELVEESLRSLTASILTHYSKLISEDEAKRRTLLDWHKDNYRYSLKRDPAELGRYIHTGLRLCRDFGVYPFARLARLAFIGRDLMGRLVVAGALSQEWVDSFWRSISTVAADVADSIIDLKSGSMSRETFNKRFGHLRPRTYDISSPRYDQIDFGTQTSLTSMSRLESLPLEKHEDELNCISSYLRAAALPHDPHEFLKFVSIAFKEREQSKFDFTIVLSQCIEAIARLGDILGFTRLELSYLTVRDILKAANSGPPSRLRSQWARRFSQRREQWETAAHIRHPSVIFGPEDLILVRPVVSSPNFVTSYKVEGQVINLISRVPKHDLRLNNKIIAIEAADPGFDWLFSHRIAALVTKFGGAASHMAVRCAEFGIPAAVGCGDELFRKVITSSRIQIDCGSKEIIFLE